MERMDTFAGPSGGDPMSRARAVSLRQLLTVGLVVSGLLGGCTGAGSATGEPGQTRRTIPPPAETGTAGCFHAWQAQDFRVLDRSNLIVYAPNDRNAYHVQVSPPSMDLRNAESLAFVPPNDRICGYAGQRLIVGGAMAGQPLAVIAVSRLSPEGLASLRSGSSGAAPPAAEPQPGPGAEIEPAPLPAPKPDSTTEK